MYFPVPAMPQYPASGIHKPKNKKRVEVPTKNIVHFKTGKELHDRLNAK